MGVKLFYFLYLLRIPYIMYYMKWDDNKAKNRFRIYIHYLNYILHLTYCNYGVGKSVLLQYFLCTYICHNRHLIILHYIIHVSRMPLTYIIIFIVYFGLNILRVDE